MFIGLVVKAVDLANSSLFLAVIHMLLVVC